MSAAAPTKRSWPSHLPSMKCYQMRLLRKVSAAATMKYHTIPLFVVPYQIIGGSTDWLLKPLKPADVDLQQPIYSRIILIWRDIESVRHPLTSPSDMPNADINVMSTAGHKHKPTANAKTSRRPKTEDKRRP